MNDPISIIDGALKFFAGGRNWGRGAAWDHGRACLMGGLAHTISPSTIGNYSTTSYAWRLIPPVLQVALMTALPERCEECQVRYAGPGMVAHHNDGHVREYAEIAALLTDVRGALVAEAERAAVEVLV